MDKWSTDIVETLVDIILKLQNKSSQLSKKLVIAITGGPGAGKSTLSAQLVQRLNSKNILSQLLPMDGFHMTNQELEVRNLRSRKGAIETFHVNDYFESVKNASLGIVFKAPEYNRELHDVISESIEINSNHEIIITEGNYLLVSIPIWEDLRELFDLVVYIDTPRNIVKARLIERQMAGGKAIEDAIIKVNDVDLKNYDFINTTRNRADYILDSNSNKLLKLPS